MGCGCEDGYQDTYIGVIEKVIDREGTQKNLSLLKKSIPEEFHRRLAEMVDKRGPDHFAVNVKIEDGSDMSMSGDLFPGGIERARALVGKRLRFTMTQLPKQGGFSVDFAELAEA